MALIGAGVIGRGWIRVFAPRCRVRIYDPDKTQSQAAARWLAADLSKDVEDGLIGAEEVQATVAALEPVDSLDRALAGAGWVQESAPERLETKRAVFAELDRRARPDAILASSSSGLDPAAIAAGLTGARRCLVAHPFNPPHIIPAVELLPAPETDPEIVTAAATFLSACGRTPVRLSRYVNGYLGNRIQAAVVREALHLVETGVAEAEAVDAVIRDGLALRWATIGNFGANHTNADGGMVEYFTRYGDAYRELMADLSSAPPAFAPTVLRTIAAAVERREGVAGVEALARKRDLLVKRLLRACRPGGGSH